METNPIITIKSTTEDWSNLGATCEPSVDQGTIQVSIHLGINRIGSFLELDVKEITDNVIRFDASFYTYELLKGDPHPVCVTYSIGGYTDHEGCDWDGTDYDYWISWK